MQQVAADATADIQGETQGEATDIPAVRRLDVKEALPTGVTKSLETSRVGIALGIALGIVAVAHCEDSPGDHSFVSRFI